MVSHRYLLAMAFTPLAASCKPDFDDRASLVDRDRILAVSAEPAEARPGETVTFRALVASPSPSGGAQTGLDWAYCVARKPLTELGPVSPSCLAPGSPSLLPLGKGAEAAGPLPVDACRLFGPDRPEPRPGEPSGRPVDPDPSGGYFQPLRLLIPTSDGGAYAVASARLLCGLASATQEQQLAFQAAYRPNQNPSVDSLLASVEGQVPSPLSPASAGAVNAPLPRGATVSFSARWAPCPRRASCGDGVCFPGETKEACPADCTTPRGCTGAESYVWFDAEDPRLALRREGLRASWFATGGAFDQDRTGVGEGEAEASSGDNVWVAPETAGEVRLWVVLRDDRGGAGWQEYRVAIE